MPQTSYVSVASVGKTRTTILLPYADVIVSILFRGVLAGSYPGWCMSRFFILVDHWFHGLALLWEKRCVKIDM